MARADKKRYYQLLRSFDDKVQKVWLDLDDQMLAILQNVASIRGRLPLEWKLLRSPDLVANEHSEIHDGDSANGAGVDGGWKFCGYGGKPRECSHAFRLRRDDARRALEHDLVQHEKMLRGLRSCMSDLAEAHEALGRVVDGTWKFHLDRVADGLRAVLSATKSREPPLNSEAA